MCGKKFESKPDYCDCGNDSFQELKPAVSEITSTPKAPDNKMILWLTVGLVVLLTLVLLLVAPKDNKKIIPDSSENDKKTTVTENKQPVQPVAPVVNQVSKPQVKIVTAAPKPQPVVKQQVKKSAVQTQTIKPQSKTRQSTPAAKVPQSATSKNTTTKVKATSSAKPKTVQTQQPVNTSTQKKPAMTEEYYNYKLTLRQALFSKLSVASVQGSGTCGIEFSIDSTGKLINRSFTFQSDNKSVNDEVYKMLMRMPKFYPPPAGMGADKIKMVFKFNNGSYYVNYVN